MRLLLSLILCLTLLAPAAGFARPGAGAGADSAYTAYIDPALRAEAGPLDVIVMAASAGEAASAVNAVGGQVRADLWLADAVAARLPAGSLPTLAAAPNVVSIVADRPIAAAGQMPNGKGSAPTPVALPYGPASLDLGVDVVHNAPRKGPALTGRGVTIAVVDSGIYFDADLRAVFDNQLRNQFLGQADFVDPVCGQRGRQASDHCFTRFHESADPYGHGTAVASVIWNPFVDDDTGAAYGVAPEARLLSVRVLDGEGRGTYARVIQGLQFVVANRARYNVRVVNLSLSAAPLGPYDADPLNQAVTAAWQAGLVVLAAAGNSGPGAGTITVPGNNPWVVTVGAYNSAGTFGQPHDDSLPSFSGAGPTLDGFAKPDVLAPGANIMAFMFNDPAGAQTQVLVQQHPDYHLGAVAAGSLTLAHTFYRMHGTSLATGLASGVTALMLQAHPSLTPNQAKARLLASALPLAHPQGELYNTFQQGLGRLWAPAAVLPAVDPSLSANQGLDPAQGGSGPVQAMLSDDGQAWLFYVAGPDGAPLGLGAARPDGAWLDAEALANARMTWAGARMTWAGARMIWSGTATDETGGAARMTWAGTSPAGVDAEQAYSSARMTWAGARMIWSGTVTAYDDAEASARMTWAGTFSPGMESPGLGAGIGATHWVADP